MSLIRLVLGVSAACAVSVLATAYPVALPGVFL
jgi:hypothetical protein